MRIVEQDDPIYKDASRTVRYLAIRQYKAQLQKVSSPQEYYRFFYALAEFPQPPLVEQTLKSTLSPEVRGQDLNLLVYMLSKPASQNPTWDFMRQHFDELVKKAGGGLGGMRVFLNGVQSFCSTQRATEVKQFFAEHSFPGTERNQKKAIESINSCVELAGQQQGVLSAWLKQNGNATAFSGGSTAVGAVH